MPNGNVVGTILPEGRLGAMTRLGLLLRDGLPDTPNEDPMAIEDDEAVAFVEHATRADAPPPLEKPKPLYQGVVSYPAPREWVEAITLARSSSYSRSQSREHERRADLEPIEFLLEYRRLITQRLAPLSAMHRHGGKWDELRKALRSKIKGQYRRDPETRGLSNDAYEDFASGDERYLAALRIAFREAQEYEDLKEELATLEHRIEARSYANTQYSAETRLQ